MKVNIEAVRAVVQNMRLDAGLVPMAAHIPTVPDSYDGLESHMYSLGTIGPRYQGVLDEFTAVAAEVSPEATSSVVRLGDAIKVMCDQLDRFLTDVKLIDDPNGDATAAGVITEAQPR